MNLPTDQPDWSATRYAEVIAKSIPPDRDDAIVVAIPPAASTFHMSLRTAAWGA